MSKTIPLAILIIALYFIYFMHLGRQPVRLWDESRLAHNALEMSRDGDFIVTHFEGSPDMWNTKPPLMIICQSILINLIGPNETALRIPAALCGMLTSLLLLYFCWKHLDKFWMGFSAALVIATTNGIIDEHGIRSAEYDGMLIFFTALYSLYFFLYVEHKKIKHLYIATAGLILAVLTKGIAGLFMLPVIAMAALIFPDSKKIFTSKHFYFSAGIFLLFTGGYYLLREHLNPGYLKAVVENEIWGRYVAPHERHDGSFWVYWDKMKNSDMEYWSPLVVCGLVSGLLSVEKLIRRIILYIFSCFLFLFLVLSFSSSKLYWYIYPAYPFLALIASYFIWILFKILEDLDLKKIHPL